MNAVLHSRTPEHAHGSTTPDAVFPRKTSQCCVSSGFRSDADEVCALLGRDAACDGNFVPTFRDNLSVLSSGVKSKMVPICRPETSVWKYRWTLRRVEEPQTLVTVTIGGLDLYIDPAQGHVSYFHCRMLGRALSHAGRWFHPSESLKRKHTVTLATGQPAWSASARLCFWLDEDEFEALVGLYWQGEPEVRWGKPIALPLFPTTNLTWTDPGSNPDLRSKRPATDRLSSDTVSLLQQKLFGGLAK